MEWYLQVLKKYAVFDGRASRSEYWYFFLFNIIIGFIFGLIDGFAGLAITSSVGVLGGIYSLVLLLPGIGVFIRRMHDTGRSGWWWLIAFVPIIGAIMMIIWLVKDSDEGTNKYGPSPKVSSTIP